MILVTVGTTMPFDELFAEVDRLVDAGVIDEPVVSQSGQSEYRMRHGEQFVGRSTIADLIEQSSLVITHGGATVVQLLIAKKPFIAYPNPRGAGDHQTGFLRRVEQVADISWSSDVRDLERLIRERRAKGAAVVKAGIPRVADIVRGVLARRPSR